MVSVWEAAMDTAIVLLAAWLPIMGIVLALCIGPDDYCEGGQMHHEPAESKH